MRIIGFVGTLLAITAGVCARMYCRSLFRDLRPNQSQNIQFDSLDDVFYSDGGGMDFGPVSGQSEPMTYKPKPAVSSGVQSNPFTE